MARTLKGIAVVIACLVASAGLVWLGSQLCRRDPAFERKVSLLFAPDGQEYWSPVHELYERLERADAKEREELIEYLADLADSSRGYLHTVAVYALYTFFYEAKYQPLMSQRAAETIAKYIIRLNEFPNMIATEQFASGHLPEEASKAVWPECVLDAEGYTVVISQGLPRGWSSKDVFVQIDGQIVVERAEPYPEPSHPMEMISLQNYITPPTGDATEEHTITVGLTLVTPNGICIPKKDRTVLHIFSARAYKQDSF